MKGRLDFALQCDGQALAGEEPYLQNLCRASIVAHGVFDPAIGGPRAPLFVSAGARASQTARFPDCLTAWFPD